MNALFRVALSGDFKKPDGSPTFPDFDLSPLFDAPGIEVVYLDPTPVIRADQIEDIDVLILLVPQFNATSIHPNGRLTAVARFGVGYDSVDVDACTKADIALVITPDGVRRPVAVSILTLILALTGKLMIKDQLTREGPDGFNRRGQHMGVGLVGKTLGSIGIGNIGAEMFRVCKPLDMRFIAHDPFADADIAGGIQLRIECQPPVAGAQLVLGHPALHQLGLQAEMRDIVRVHRRVGLVGWHHIPDLEAVVGGRRRREDQIERDGPLAVGDGQSVGSGFQVHQAA